MRTLSPLHVATAAVMALAVSTAFAQAPARPQGATASSPRTVALPSTVSTSPGTNPDTMSITPGVSGTSATTNTTNGGTDSGLSGSGTPAGTGSNNNNSLNSNTNRLNGFVPGATGVSTSENGTTVNVNPSQAGSTVLTLPASTPTPLLNETARRAQAREENRRASGREPRVIGIAPRTNADKTDQMPDDRVIRY